MTTELEIELLRLAAEGYCCSQIMVAKALELRDEENPALMEAAAALGNGLQSGHLCGALSGAACFLSLLAGDSAPDLIMRLNEWFASEFGTVNCGELTSGGDPERKTEICPSLIAAVYEKALDLVEDVCEN